MKKKKKIIKELQDFIMDESGFIKKENMLKIGLGTISAVGIMSAFSPNISAQHTSHTSHANALGIDVNPPVPAGCAKVVHASTVSHTSHGNHANHSSHSSY